MSCISQTKVNGCRKLTVDKCTGSTCPFYITKEQSKASRKKADKRLAGLDRVLQLYISDKYYKGKTPWLKEDNTYGR